MTQDKIDASLIVNTITKCMEWTRATVPNSYGKVQFENRLWLVHRLMWTLKKGKIPKNLCVLHKCDNVKCCNVDHLFLGTQKENVRDCIDKNRHKAPVGVENGNTKLTVLQIINIRRDNRSNVVIAAEYGVQSGQITKIKKRQQWKHI